MGIVARVNQRVKMAVVGVGGNWGREILFERMLGASQFDSHNTVS